MAVRKRKKAGKKARTGETVRRLEKKQLINHGITGIMFLFAAILIILECADIIGYTYQWWRELGAAF